MPVFVKDTLADAACLEAADRGVYWSLQYLLWQAGGTLTLSDSQMARGAGVEVNAWTAIWSRLRDRFVEKNGTISHPGVTEALERAGAKKESLRRGAALTNVKRWNKKEGGRLATLERPVSASLGVSHPDPYLDPDPKPDSDPEFLPSVKMRFAPLVMTKQGWDAMKKREDDEMKNRAREEEKP